MNEELTKKAEIAIIDLIDTLVKAKDFAVEQTPDVIQQLLSWQLFVSLSWAGVCMIIMLVCSGVSVWAFKTDEGEVGGWFCVFSIAFFVVTCVHLTVAAKVWVAPKVWLIEYAAALV